MKNRIFNILAVAVIVLQSIVCFGEPMDIYELEFKNGVYYFKNKLYTGEVKTENPEGGDYSIGNMKNGKFNGERKWFRSNGNLSNVANYKDGKQHGERKEFDKNGKLKNAGNYKDGKKHGEWKEFYENGNLSGVINYINGKKNGEWKEFYENGELMTSAGVKGTFIDSRDDKEYKTVKIGEQVWMAENLNYNASGSVCYDNKPANCEIYGRLYDCNTAMKACPSGWYLPGGYEWNILMQTVNPRCKNGGDDYIYYSPSCSGAGRKLKAKNGWGEGNNGTDIYGFSALPGGRYISSSYGEGRFSDKHGYWWADMEDGCSLRTYFGDDATSDFADNTDRLSVRCIQDLENDSFTTDI